MTESYKELKFWLLLLHPWCEVCGKNRSMEVNHCLYHKHGGIYDSFENCQAVCCECRDRQKDNSRTERDKHWDKRVKEGFAMDIWNKTVPKSRRIGYGTR